MKQNKSILFLTRLYHPHIGGVEKHVSEISKILLARGYSITILTEQYDKKLRKREEFDGIKIIRIPISKNTFAKKFWIWKYIFLNAFLFKDYEIVHVHDVFFWLYPVLPILFFKKFFITFHGYEGFPIKKTWIWQRRLAEKLSKGSICVGDFMKKWYFANPSKVIYGGVSLPDKTKQANPFSAVFFGRLDGQTGISEYIKAYNILKKKYPKFKLTIVGEGELSSKIPKDVLATGFKNNIENYIATNRFIFISRYLSMLEALVQKKEVVSVYTDSIKKDYLEMSPFKNYVHIAKNELEIAEFVENSIKKGENKKRVQNGYTWAKNQTWEKVVEDYLSLWGFRKR